MTELTNEQREEVRRWIESGQGLSEIQKQLKESFQLNLTYLDTRLLLDDLKLQPKDPEKPEPIVEEIPDTLNDEPEPAVNPAQPPAGDVPEATTGGNVSVSMDRITRPGSVLSGKVTFSDGTGAEWFLDDMGRLGLNAETPGYRPSESDLLSFQTELKKLVQSGA